MIVITHCNMSAMTIAPMKKAENKKTPVHSDATHVLVKRIRIRVRIIESYGRNSLGTSHLYTKKTTHTIVCIAYQVIATDNFVARTETITKKRVCVVDASSCSSL
jgi:hypothetical protein